MSIDWYNGLTVKKDPDAVIDWFWDWSDWLATGDSIVAQTTTPEAGITIDSSSVSGDGVNVVLSGGTAGTEYDVTVQIETNNGLIDDRTVIFKVGER